MPSSWDKETRYNATMWRHSWRGCIRTTAFFVIACQVQSWGQERDVKSGDLVTRAGQAPPQHEPHRFWDRTNTFLFSGVGVFRGLDYASTRNMLARGRAEILLPDDVVNNSAAFAGVEAGGTAVSVGLSYWMHRTGHHKLERWVSITHIGVTGFGAARNYALKTHRASAP